RSRPRHVQARRGRVRPPVHGLRRRRRARELFDQGRQDRGVVPRVHQSPTRLTGGLSPHHVGRHDCSLMPDSQASAASLEFREIGYAIQQIGLFPHWSIADNIATVPKLLGWPKDRIKARVSELLELIGLDASLARRYPAQLSGGQRQRVGVARALAADPPLMLMDEPFGAIDPINRERLQNEFLRLQAEIRKTIVFVTHDIDEAIKMGDKIAILKEGGHLAQFAPPAELLMYPAEPFVEDFVGADRALKRLALQRVRDIDLWKAATVRAGESVAEARAKLEDADLDIPLLVDDHGRPKGWLSERGLQGERVREELRSPAEPVVELDDILRDALSDLLGHDTQYSPVVDADGCVAGVLSMEVLAHALSQPAEHIPTASELAAREEEPVR